MTADQNNFRSWIEAGFKHYGKDPWFFIRELAQNSRDAGATEIKVRIGYTADKEEVLIFEDNGCGMSYAHAKQFLFRLYASSKTRDDHSAGMFGIGFWTVLKFDPSQVIIESQWQKGRHKENWGIQIQVGETLKTRPAPCHLQVVGTRVTLIRPAQEPTEKEFYHQTREALRRYCTYLRRNNSKGDPLPVFFDGKTMVSEMKLPGPVTLQFNDGAVEGAVGLAPQPRVYLYVRGLPVWEGTSLEELSHTPPEKTLTSPFGQGLAPVFLLNGNRLEVNISRQKVIDDRHLQQVRKTAERALASMVANAADAMSPRSTGRRLLDKMKASGSTLLGLFGKTFLVILLMLVVLEIFLIKSFYKPSPRLETPFSLSGGGTISLRADGPRYQGASVSPENENTETGFSYTPPEDRFFTLFYADQYKPALGFIQTRLPETAGPPAPEISMNTRTHEIGVTLDIPAEGIIFLPQPLFYGIAAASITINGTLVPAGRFHVLPTGEAVLQVRPKGTVRYRCFALKGVPPPPPYLRSQWHTLPPGFQLPGTLEQQLRQELPSVTSKKLATALQLTASVCRYDTSQATALQYANLQKNGNWFRRVSEIGAGDCDILNGLTVLFLRKMGVPARLVIGAVGRRGKILPILHAWTEYYESNGNLGMVDASNYTPHSPGEKNNAMDAALGGGKQGSAGTALNGGAGNNPMNGSYRKNRVAIYTLGSLIIFLVGVLVVLLAKEMTKSPRVSPAVLTEVEKCLAGMALHTLVHPNQGLWGSAGGIMDFNIIPTCTGRPISLRRALKLGQTQKLFTSSMENPILSNMRHLGGGFTVPILDASHTAYAPLLKLLPGAVFLDQVAALKAINPEKAKASWMGQLVVAVNQLLAQVGGQRVPPCWLATGEMSGDFFDVDLSPLPKWRQKVMPRRLVVVNPASNALSPLAALFKTNPVLAQFRFIQLLLKESRLLPLDSVLLLEKVASHLLLGQSGDTLT